MVITTGIILMLAFTVACTESHPPERPDPTNTVQASSSAAESPSASGYTTETPETVPAPAGASTAAAGGGEKPEPARLEPAQGSATSTNNICWRTPEVQEKFIEDLRIPSCQLINDAELFRVREFRVNAPEVMPGDFAHMPNLRELQIAGLRELPEAGTFDGLSTLQKLNIRITNDGWSEWGKPRPTEVTVSEEMFDGLESLRSLEIDTGKSDLVLGDKALDGPHALEYIRLGSIREISAGDLTGLSEVRYVNISYTEKPNEDQETPIIPKDLLARIPSIEVLEVHGFGWPTALEMNSLEHVCLVKDSGYIPNETVMTVDGEVTQYQGRERRDGRSLCILKVGEEIQEIPWPER